MSVTAASLKAGYPEFNDATDALVNAKIANALLETDSDVWGTNYDHGVTLLACHYLALSPDGRAMRLDPDGKAGHYGLGQSIYGQMYERLKVAVACGLGRVV